MKINANSYDCSQGTSYTEGSSAYPTYPSFQMHASHKLTPTIMDMSTNTSPHKNEAAFFLIGKKTYIARVPTYVISPIHSKNDTKILYVHGGGFIKSIHLAHTTMLKDLANRTGSKIYVPLYSLADNSIFPTQRNEIFKVYKKLKSSYGSENIVFMGDSAGGNLVLSVMKKLRKKNILQPSKVVLISPWMDLKMDNPYISYYDRRDYILSKSWLDIAARKYLGSKYNSSMLDKASVSPINLKKLSDFPPMLYITGNRDLFYPDSIKFKNRAISEGLDLTFIDVNGGFHVFPLAPHLIVPESNIAREQIASFINCK